MLKAAGYYAFAGAITAASLAGGIWSIHRFCKAFKESVAK